jgi:hypothetical protein
LGQVENKWRRRKGKGSRQQKCEIFWGFWNKLFEFLVGRNSIDTSFRPETRRVDRWKPSSRKGAVGRASGDISRVTLNFDIDCVGHLLE